MQAYAYVMCASLTYGLDLEVLYSKTSLVRATVSISTRNDDLCPSRALSAYFAHFPARGLPARGDDPLFVTFAGGVQPAPMSAEEFVVLLCASCMPELSPDCPPAALRRTFIPPWRSHRAEARRRS